MKEKLTLKRTIELCKELWLWLAKNPNMSKANWPQWHKYSNVDSFCFACEYIFQKQENNKQKDCHNCPLKDLWPNGCISTPNSPYRLYSISYYNADKKRYAKMIVDFCDKELKKLNKKEKTNGKKN